MSSGDHRSGQLTKSHSKSTRGGQRKQTQIVDARENSSRRPEFDIVSLVLVIGLVGLAAVAMFRGDSAHVTSILGMLALVVGAQFHRPMPAKERRK